MTHVTTQIPLVNARYIKNRTKRGKVSTTKMRDAVHYIGFGHRFENPQQLQRGQWHSPNGTVEHATVVQWSEQQAQRHKYTYTFILSLRDGVMEDSDFTETLNHLTADADNEFPADWRLMVHRDSNHDHAHLVLFRDTTLRKAELAQWRQQLQHDLAIREEQRLYEQLQSETAVMLE